MDSDSLLQITSRIEAAVQAYGTVRDLVRDVKDRAEWKRHFELERVIV
jgi:hypothetical protein